MTMPVPTRSVRGAHAAMLLYAALISSSFSIGDRITDALPPHVLVAERFVIGAVAFFILARLRGTSVRPHGTLVARAGVLALVMIVFFLLMFEALRSTDPVRTGAIFCALPLLSAAAARVIMGQHTRASQWALLMLGAVGAAFVVFDGSFGAAGAVSLGRGELLFFLGTLSFSLYSPLVRRLHGGDDLIVLTFWTLAVGAIGLSLVSLPTALVTPWDGVGWRVHAGIAWLGIANTALTFLLIKFASTRLPSSKVMAYTLLTPVFVVAIELVLGAGWPALPLTLGLVVVVTATGWLQTTRDE